ncbi:hypothetical protein C8N46_104307 [Kordia periserrulae]|uniref:Uncharacterized protein n=1 Tax=Kordia periserrulae TaxID=701523 RepID=A0A2T6C022_9FLAO|nr:hypothetical protein [Kordia periserrulae]PTX61663.1 hypothetical protein C8N46_104307 [Kordia periserrulae]
MSKETFCEAEERRMNKILNFGLPNSYKKLGIILVALSILFLITRKIFDIEISETIRFILKRVVLVGLLIIAISKEKVEDEMIQSMRGRAFTMAFIFGVIFSLAQPLFNYIASFIVEKEDDGLTDVGDFQVLWLLLTIYLLFFYMLKRRL